MQHDVAEFLTHVLNRLPYTMNKLAIPWQARSSGQNWRVQDLGCSAPMVLQACESEGASSLRRRTVQDMIDAWHRQEDVHALVHWPSAIVLQSGRFDFDAGHNCALERRYELDPSPVIRMPGFGHEQAMPWKQYQLCSVIIHLGDSPDSGHYFNLIFDIRDSSYYIAVMVLFLALVELLRLIVIPKTCTCSSIVKAAELCNWAYVPGVRECLVGDVLCAAKAELKACPSVSFAESTLLLRGK